MKWVVSKKELLLGAVTLKPVCSNCGCEELYVQEPGMMLRLDVCPVCSHQITWRSYLDEHE